MATRNNVHIPEDLLAEITAKAAEEGKTVDQLAEEAVRKGLEDRSWQDLIAYGFERGRSLGFTEEQAADVSASASDGD